MHATEAQSRRKAPARKRKDDLLRDLFGEENPDLPSPQDRWINIQAVVREVYKELGREYGFIDKRWTEITPRWKIDLSNEVLSRLADPDRRVLEFRPDVVERLLKDHVSNRGDWKKEKARKVHQRQERHSPSSDRTSPQAASVSSGSPYEEKMEYEFTVVSRSEAHAQTSALPPLSTFVEGVERMKGSPRVLPRRLIVAAPPPAHAHAQAQQSAAFGY
ncbi:hypothetical protein H072_11486 [Dactylellina haptotyla CBS 200.50]|uniref:Uncharacterized protein n=1 Tax=Dactylellina haptotyla (strain CBS 200.50) TaxID=1284197 RepID=S7ZXH4_DACHA|nr:hypothetical protein H072_11486 [Dactylellina haptotyla CBS 200.50]